MAMFSLGLGQSACAVEPDLHAGFDAVLRGAIHDGLVDYEVIRTRREALGAYTARLADPAHAALSGDAAMAFWLNAYNAWTLALVVDERPRESIRELDGGKVWTRRSFTVAGRSVTLDAMEHKILRPMGDARVHAVLNCASMGCPPMPRTAAPAQGLDGYLDEATRAWAKHNAWRVEGDTLYLSSVFDWFGEDFASKRARPVTGADDKQAAAVHFLRAYSPALDKALRNVATVSWEPWDWALNRRP